MNSIELLKIKKCNINDIQQILDKYNYKIQITLSNNKIINNLSDLL